jgi:hypothetical protein
MERNIANVRCSSSLLVEEQFQSSEDAMHLVSPEGSPATEASGGGRAVEGRPVLVKLLLEGQYLYTRDDETRPSTNTVY